ncbi:transposable element Tcb1 transposase [Trichonephila inaurata madagascariensis]|uniref:Transposable element Tcb1 transposase n=1 Tax=Trichonephila inaurata madagascariensis TaxID=2747483 RepID=A0A8X6WYA7_9ARAC|nr:transposable element Tcb1 transposase [Trichonephila inaurata madagascariensis]
MMTTLRIYGRVLNLKVLRGIPSLLTWEKLGNAQGNEKTVRNVLHSAGLKTRIPKKKPYISEVNRKRRLEFAMKYKNKPMDFWKVIFSDESKFEIFTPPSIRKIWRKNKTALEPKNVISTLKHSGGNVMVWGCGQGNLAFIDNKMNALAYIDVLQHNLLDSAQKLSMENTFIFQQDNDLKYTASYQDLVASKAN